MLDNITSVRVFDDKHVTASSVRKYRHCLFCQFEEPKEGAY